MGADLLKIKDYFTMDQILQFLEEYASLGPIPGLLLPFLEAIFPILPLVLFVMANAAAFGLWEGFLYSWLGACTGAIFVFLVIRKIGQKRQLQFLHKNKKIKKSMEWLERHGFGPLFLLLCFPFTPSSIINVVAALSKVSVNQFLLAVLLGKFVMIFTISWIGHDIVSLVNQPVRTIMLVLFILALWYVGKRIEIRLQKQGRQKLTGKE
jgi:uncharacterized membrane protein YdjX (TVP38/TMEM64 family)